MNPTEEALRHVSLVNALCADDPSVRLRAALAAGSHPDSNTVETLVERCAVQPDFFVRDMLSWALACLPPEITLPRIRAELDRGCTRARSQALHTLSKIGDGSTWEWIRYEMLRDADDEVARTAWRAAVTLVPGPARVELAEELVRQLGRGDREVQLSLSRALVDLGDVLEPALARAARSSDPGVADHARMTGLMLRDRDIGT